MTNREKQILQVLAAATCVLSDDQIARTWWNDGSNGKHRMRQTMHRLEVRGWIHRQRVLARAAPQMDKPFFGWDAGNATPDFQLYSQLLHQRANQPLVTASICLATAKSNLLFGCGKRSSVRLTQLTHELQVSEVYLRLRNNLHSDLKWVSGDRLPEDWRLNVCPDALLVDSSGNFVRAIEYGGAYSVKRLESLHEAMASIFLSYELW